MARVASAASARSTDSNCSFFETPFDTPPAALRAARRLARLLLPRVESLRSEEDAMQETMETRARVAGNEPYQHSEGAVARTLEQQTAKLPSDFWLWAAVASMSASLLQQLTGRKHESLFVAHWAAPFLLFGTYNKLVKIAGSDRVHH